MGSQSADQGAKDVAAHILAQLLTSREMKNVEEEQKSLMSFLLGAQNAKDDLGRTISSLGFSCALVHLLKIHDILQYFIASNGVQT
ncbi:MAG: hypothetical protein P4M11_08295 [Candidatus Pacebacteria bacterium]|nr:hypothetical protein [Candidatus Paceibacterota bacterium]